MNKQIGLLRRVLAQILPALQLVRLQIRDNSATNAAIRTSAHRIAIASLILLAWAFTLIIAFRLDVHSIHPLWRILLLSWQTFLYVGLFMTAHDAMHGNVAPGHPQLNHEIGFIALLVYGSLDYATLRQAHEQHHRYPGSSHDPDFHDGKHKHLLFWYIRFMCRYFTIWQGLRLIGTYHFLHLVGHIAEANLIWFWIAPSLLSSMQLFYFGTFLAHREIAGTKQNRFHANSIYRPFLWSLFTCYHFGYHHEHHEFPHLTWWQLPSAAKPNSVMADVMAE